VQLWSRVLVDSRRALAFLNISPEVVQERLCIPWKALSWLGDLEAQVLIAHILGCTLLAEVGGGGVLAALQGVSNWEIYMQSPI